MVFEITSVCVSVQKPKEYILKWTKTYEKIEINKLIEYMIRKEQFFDRYSHFKLFI